MTYDAREKSRQDGSPVELYKFTQRGNTWMYTSGDTAINAPSLGGVFECIPIKRTAIDQSQEDTAGTIDVTVSRDNPLAGMYIAYNPSTPVWLTVYRYHEGDGETRTIWIGRIVSVSFPGSEAVIKCSPIQTVTQRRIPRNFYQTVCNRILYSQSCGMIPGAFCVRGAVTAISGSTLTVYGANSKADGFFTLGFATRNGDEVRMIVAHTGSTVTLLNTFFNLQVGDVIEIYAGCDRTEGTCRSKFNNITNFLGWKYIPTKNPFDTGLG